MMSAGFQWGLNNNNLNNNNTTQNFSKPSFQLSSVPRSSVVTSAFSKKRKRIMEDESDEDTQNLHTERKTFTFKKSRTPKIIGQPLPTSRLIETLDKSSLQKLLNNLIQTNPSITSQIYRESPSPSISNLIEILQFKFQYIIDHLPYKCDTESDYSYLRIKNYFNEFLNCLSDFILWTLPPNNNNFNLHNLLYFFQEVTSLIFKLPNFTNSEFQYTKNLAYEQISNSWLIIINSQIDDIENDNNSDNLKSITESIKVIKEFELLSKLEKFNQYDNNYKFQNVIDYLNKKIEQFEIITNNQENNSLNELITIDYSQYSLKNSSI
ncbi:unnamed protein product [Candida verbasci]|uniref:Tethering factor for nuclear proteasome STS1 n=1 Tax=Candida verbasci TaxID=1227364 RepID=A0A9W4TW33_9ASCO|nr:unnamed protein product [Candida verbasci]